MYALVTKSDITGLNRCPERLRRKGIIPALIGISAAIFGSVSHAQTSEEEFYRGKQLSLMVGFPPGGGYDLYARVVARHMPKFLPGNTGLIVQNMPGASSMNLANFIYNTAPRDGTVFGSIDANIPFEAYLGGTGVRFEPLNFTWIGGLNQEVTTCQVWHTSSARSLGDLASKEFPFAGTGPSAPEFEAKLLNNVLGTKIKLISGYRGLADVYTSIERGEVEGSCGLNWGSVISVKADWVKTGKLIPLVQITNVRHGDLPHVPTILELARNSDELNALKLLTYPNRIGRPYIAPPGLSPVRAKVLRDAFSQTMKDKEFLADAGKANLPIDPVNAETIAQILGEIAKTDKSVIDRVIQARR